MREHLKSNSNIKLESVSESGRTRIFAISSVLGHGSSCVAYRATDANNIPVVVKECFPLSKTSRNNDGTVVWKNTDDEKRA